MVKSQVHTVLLSGKLEGEMKRDNTFQNKIKKNTLDG